MDERTYPTVDGDVTYWVSHEAGPDAAWLVFLPGLTADHTLFEAQMTHFEGRANWLVWDAPAHGKSRPFALTFTMDSFVDILRGIFAAEGIKRPVLVGQSLGGYIAQVFVDRYPDELRGIITIDSSPLKRSYFTGWEIWLLRHTHTMYLSIPWSLLQKWGVSGTARTEAGRANMLAMMQSYEKREYVDLAAHGYATLADAAAAARPYEITCPLLVLCGEHDEAASTRRYNRMWEKREGVNLVWVPDAGHNANVDNPAFVNAQIEQFLDEIAAD